MLWFNSYTYFGLDLIATFQYILCYGSTSLWCRGWFGRIISIHLMLWFNFYQNLSYEPTKQFQYILCYGSTLITLNVGSIENDFNTSYVMVQRCLIKTISPSIIISIHLMLWFNLLSVYSTS